MGRAVAVTPWGDRQVFSAIRLRGVKIVDSYAETAAFRDRKDLAGPVLRIKSVTARMIYAHLATGGALGYDELIDTFAQTRTLPPQTLREEKRRTWLAALARVMAAQNVRDGDQNTALALLDAVYDAAGPDSLNTDEQATYAQLLFSQQRYGRDDVVLPTLTLIPDVVSEYLRIDLANPFLRPEHDLDEWLALLNGPFVRANVEPVRLLAEGPTPFDRLTAQSEPATADGPLVSVIMSAYQPDEFLRSAVRSILDQTWRDLELIIVDDASGPDYDERLAGVQRLDDRIRIVRQETNGGTYVARNAGLESARGEFVTFQDSDDWSHPRRIEHQVAPLLADDRLMGTRSVAVRAHDDLTHQWLGYPAHRVNASSLLFRRQAVLEKIGFFDSVRKSADFEFAFRLEAVSGRKIRDLRVPLACTRLRQSSLSRSDFTLGWSAASRIAYQAAYRQWHRAVAAGTADPYLPRHPVQRPFPAPASYLRGIADAARRTRRYDVVFVEDLMPHSGPKDGLIEEIGILAARGLSVGVVHAEALCWMTAKRQHAGGVFQALVNEGTVDRLTLADDVSAALVIVRDPAVLQFTQSTPATLQADRVLIAPRLSADGYPPVAVAYDEQTCIDNARNLFRVPPTWDANLDVAPVELDRWATPRGRRRSLTRPVIGRYDADRTETWPETATELLLAYPGVPDVDVRILGGTSAPAKLLERPVPREWLVYGRDQISLRAFLYQLDFFVYFPSSGLGAPATDVLVKAMASGAVVVLPERFRSVFGEAAVYCAPADVVAVVRKLHGDDAGYANLVRRAREFVANRHSAAAYARRVETLISRR